ncbi:beta-glucosidase 11-like isoform X1 [Vigna unguiculata]|uniref:beta-glucosidase 11-like isoform X1 n=1 Tax=Vigna unguiculata TaxID=3917 RepID=UPI001016CD87|nr:beta-glucosidase 11-like isoform X1 [Vigna unguiculata]
MRLMMKVFAVIGLVLLIVHPGTHALSRDQFPPDFVFGASTSAYQLEGAANEDGRKPSIWDTFSHAGNADLYAGDGDIASDHYHKYKEDVNLMANMGLEAYRFSISWSRLIPEGRGQVNPKGLQFYNNLIDELINHGIEAHVTLYHWDLPQALEDEYGGWVSRRVVKDFTKYAEVCFKEFGDRVKYWTTMNEANIHVLMGYDLGLLQPQRCSPNTIMNCSRGNSSTEPYLAAHHMLLAHASAARVYRKKYQGMQHGFIGFSLLLQGFLPQTNSTEDIMAVQRVQDFFIGWFMNPFIFGDYPDIMKKNAGSRLPSFIQKESNLVKGSIDFLGINFYFSYYVKDSPDNLKKENRDYLADFSAKLQLYLPNITTKFEVPITPKILLRMLDSLRNAYGNIPIFIHENGQLTPHNSPLEDWSRVNYLHAYIGSMVDVLRSGLNVKGYFVWSFMDVFEIGSGYELSYGLYYVDMNDPNLRRKPKLSAKWYSNFLKGKPMDPKITETQNNASVLSHIPSLHSGT